MSAPIIAFVAFADVQNLDIAGPWEVFSGADRLLRESGHTGYTLRLATWSGEPVRTSSGLLLTPDLACDELDDVDTLVVAGGVGVTEALRSSELVAWIRECSARRLASVCTGAFLLAEAGLLDGRSATTHWSRCEELARRYPQVDVQPEPIFVHDGVYTSAGVTAGIDLALALVEADHHTTLSLDLARWLVLFLRRPAGQAQFSVQLSHQTAERRPIAAVQVWISDNLSGDLSIDALARRVAMSPRNFTRVFREQVGCTAAVYVKSARIEGARQRLEGSDEALEQVARECGLGSTESLRRSFLASFGVPPSVYRRRFR